MAALLHRKHSGLLDVTPACSIGEGGIETAGGGVDVRVERDVLDSGDTWLMDDALFLFVLICAT
jgi:hypothetical protein